MSTERKEKREKAPADTGEFFDNNVRNVHGNDADGEPCDLGLETEWSGPIHPETGEELTCTCGYEQFEAELREFHPGLFREDFAS